MTDNIANDGHGGPMPPPTRRLYKRIPPQEWEERKHQIRTLYIEQNLSTAQVADSMKDIYGFDAGEKQFKRKFEEWGFTKNITNREMMKMVRKRKRREDEDEKETVFKRTRNGIDFEEVAPEKIDRFQKRHGLEEFQVGSESSGMPSNILYETPSNSHMIHSTWKDAGTALSRSQTPSYEVESSRRINQQVKQILERSLNQVKFRLPFGSSPRWGHDGATFAFQECYDEARKSFEQDSAKVAAWRGKRHWLAVGLHHTASLMEAASHPGCPQTLSLRLTQKLAQRLMIERQKYLALPSDEQSTEELQHIITGLIQTTQTWTEVVVIQKALKVWQPILGIHHPELTIIRRRLEEHKQVPGQPIENIIWGLHEAPAPPIQPIQNFLHRQRDGPTDKLLELAPLLEFTTDDLSFEVKDKMLQVYRGRSHAFLGGYYSFLGDFERAEQAFQESERTLEVETCVEIKLHRMLWHSEHYTRVNNWSGVSLLLYEAHKVFMAQDTASTFVLSHFPNRFRLLCKAVSALVPIDEVVHDVSIYSRDEPGGSRAISIQPETPQAPIPVLEVGRLFPLGSTDHSTIDIDAWRQYVSFSPQAGSLMPSPSIGNAFLSPHLAARG